MIMKIIMIINIEYVNMINSNISTIITQYINVFIVIVLISALTTFLFLLAKLITLNNICIILYIKFILLICFLIPFKLLFNSLELNHLYFIISAVSSTLFVTMLYLYLDIELPNKYKYIFILIISIIIYAIIYSIYYWIFSLIFVVNEGELYITFITSISQLLVCNIFIESLIEWTVNSMDISSLLNPLPENNDANNEGNAGNNNQENPNTTDISAVHVRGLGQQIEERAQAILRRRRSMGNNYKSITLHDLQIERGDNNADIINYFAHKYRGNNLKTKSFIGRYFRGKGFKYLIIYSEETRNINNVHNNIVRSMRNFQDH